MGTNTVNTQIIDHPKPTTLSQVFRLFGEQNVTDSELNGLLTSGLLARLLNTPNPAQVNLTAFERALGIADPLPDMKRPILVDLGMSPTRLVASSQGAIVVTDDKHEKVNDIPLSPTGFMTVKTVLTQVRHPRYGSVKKAEEGKGVRSADLRELLTFVRTYILKDYEGVPIFALGTRTRECHSRYPEVFFVVPQSKTLLLKHCSSYQRFPDNALFLGIALGE